MQSAAQSVRVAHMNPAAFVSSSAGESEPLLEMLGIEKSFSGVSALSGVSFKVRPGEVHALLGENGAGKSTLMKVLAGAHRADAGDILFSGEVVSTPTPAEMINRGVAVIYQEFAQAEHLTVAENIFMNRMPRKRFDMIDWSAMAKQSVECMARLGFSIDPFKRIDELSVAQRQMVEIARAVSRNAKLIVLDEPSAVLGDSELAKLFETIRSLQSEGVSFIYISHRLQEIFEIAQHITVLRDGRVVSSQAIEAWDTDSLIRAMVGRPVTDFFPPRNPNLGREVLRVNGLSRTGVLDNINFSLRSGEILGICGLAGAGRSELLRAIVGADGIDGGEVSINGQATKIGSPRQALAHGIGFVPEDRKTEGLFLNQSVAFNILIAKLDKFADLSAEKACVEKLVEQLRVKTANIDLDVGHLSGGNQQKCVIAKQLNAGCTILLVDEPTRGVDVGARREIYDLLVSLTENSGLSILMVSSELPEVIGMCDRLLVMCEGKVTAELNKSEATEEEIMRHACPH
ncbi:sugar ABC transporter ATP-binding protein [Pseudomonas extremaustralis]|uniref:sugar ABC transporter ATP-binding protein n=1 Tax=Pseudomonas extremaustralis TaxID=359110 RepID=UPI002864AD88|nr:sugar ABC transporter ATP-binding protein [Pseudomonas extremaustralis]MDR6581556.1 ribose transport system ATP-binding protein [Pseudomonas extremaustralis]